MRAAPILAPLMLFALLASPAASACSVLPEPAFSMLAVAEDGALVGNQNGGVGRLWPANGTFSPQARLGFLGPEALSPDGRWLAVERADVGGMCDRSNESLEVMDLGGGAARLLLHERVVALAASREHLAVARPASDAIEIYAWASGALVRELRVDLREAYAARGIDWYGMGWQANEAFHLAFSPDGSRLASVSGASRYLVVFDVATGKLVRQHAPEYGLPSGDPLVALAFSPDGKRLAGVTSQGTRFSEVFVWDLEAEGNAVEALRRDVEAATGMRWTDSGLVVAYADDEWPPSDASGGVLRLFSPALDVLAESNASNGASGGLAVDREILYVGTPVGVELRQLPTLDHLSTSIPGGAPVVPPMRPPTEPDEPPAPTPRRDAPGFGMVLVVMGILAATRACRAGRR